MDFAPRLKNGDKFENNSVRGLHREYETMTLVGVLTIVAWASPENKMR